MFANGDAQVFLEALTRWAFKDNAYPPPEVQKRLRQFAAETDRTYEEVRLMHFTRLHSFWPKDGETVYRNRWCLTSAFESMLFPRNPAMSLANMQGSKGFTVQKRFAQRALSEVFEDYAGNSSLYYDIAYHRGQNAVRLSKITHEMSLEFHVFFRGGRRPAVHNTLQITQSEKLIAVARFNELFGDDSWRQIFEEHDAERHLTELRGYIDLVCAFADRRLG